MFKLRIRREDKEIKERTEGTWLRDRVALPIENRGKPTSAHLEATIPI